MAVSHVALLHELVTTTGFTARVEKDGTLAFNAKDLSSQQVEKLAEFKMRFKLPMAIKRVGAGLRVGIGASALTADTSLKFHNRGEKGFNVSLLNDDNLDTLFAYAVTQPLTIKRSGTGLRIEYVGK